MTDSKFTRQDEDIAAPEFESEEGEDHHDFGNWPELFGVIMTAVLIYLTFALNG